MSYKISLFADYTSYSICAIENYNDNYVIRKIRNFDNVNYLEIIIKQFKEEFEFEHITINHHPQTNKLFIQLKNLNIKPQYKYISPSFDNILKLANLVTNKNIEFGSSKTTQINILKNFVEASKSGQIPTILGSIMLNIELEKSENGSRSNLFTIKNMYESESLSLYEDWIKNNR